MTGRYFDGLFGIVLILNTLIGVIMEYKASQMIKNLQVLTGAKQTVLKNKNEVKIPYEEIVEGDILLLKSGDEIPVDGTLMLNDYIEFDESNITGESISIVRKKGEKILSGSVVVSGYNKLKANTSTYDSYAGQLTQKAKVFSLSKSKIRTEINTLLKVLCVIIFPLMVLLYINELKNIYFNFPNIFETTNEKLAIAHSVAGVVGMIPEGLVLLISVNFAISAIILSKKKVLAQELSAIEVLSRVNTLCIDKTGTITTGNIKIKSIQYLKYEQLVKQILKKFSIQKDANQTAKSFKKINAKDIKITKYIPFSSERKYSSLTTNKKQFILGSPDNLLTKTQNAKYFNSNYRNLVLCVKTLKRNTPVAIIQFEDEIRKDAKKTLKYFIKNGVDIKIISGDNIKTITNIAKRVGLSIKNTLDLSIEKMPNSFNDISIIARCKPQQKEQIIKNLQQKGNVVAMTGDGVNDVLALKKADLAISMPNGANVVKSISQLILSDGTFSSMPQIVLEGRRIIGNMTRSAILFLVKTTIAILTSLFAIIIASKYPFLPRQLTLLSIWTIGVPGFLLSIEPNYKKFRNDFLKTVLTNAVPFGVINGVLSFVIYFLSPIDEKSSNAVILLLFLGLYILLKVIKPINFYKFAVFLFSTIGTILCLTVFAKYFIISFSLLNNGLLIFCFFLIGIFFIEMLNWIKV